MMKKTAARIRDPRRMQLSPLKGIATLSHSQKFPTHLIIHRHQFIGLSFVVKNFFPCIQWLPNTGALASVIRQAEYDVVDFTFEMRIFNQNNVVRMVM